MDSDLADTSDRSREHRGSSQLFLLRVWLDDGPAENDWQGRVQHSVTGEAHYFRTCAELRRIIRDMLASTKSDQFVDEV
jgi:hypothetical protein